jgi:hypothetical protein
LARQITEAERNRYGLSWNDTWVGGWSLRKSRCGKDRRQRLPQLVAADEARVGQKNKITRRWAKRGTRPIAPRDQRTASTYIFGAVCPRKGAALIAAQAGPLAWRL